MNISRRAFLTGLLAAPIILRPGIIMPVRPLHQRYDCYMEYGGSAASSPFQVTVITILGGRHDLHRGDFVALTRKGTLKRWTSHKDMLAGIYVGHVDRLPGSFS